MQVTLFLAIALLPTSVAAQEFRPSGPLRAERVQRGDTTVVRTLSGSTWGEKARLVEELRIGTRDGDGPDAFGEIRSFALFADGVMAVFDRSVPALRLFDPAGKYLRTIGRSGAGPGEYRSDVLGLAVGRGGVLVMYDFGNSRLNRWKRDGTVLPAWRWNIRPTLYALTNALLVDTAGNTFVLVAAERVQPGKDPRRGFARFDAEGRLRDTLQQPFIEGPDAAAVVPFSPYKQWFPTRAGSAVSAFSGVYAITVSGPGRATVRIERVAPRVAVLSGERRAFEEYNAARSGAPGIQMPASQSSLPSVKPYFSQLHSDLDGRVWVQLRARAEEFDPPPAPPRQGRPAMPPMRWREKATWDVFQRDGTYLGQLELPWRTTLSEAKGNRVWAIQQGDDDEQYVVRYRIEVK